MLKSPGQQVTEPAPKVVTIKGSSTGTKVFIGVTLKGPMGLGPAITRFDQFVDTYGSFTANGWTTYAIWSLFQGNPGAKVYIVRVAHYTDINTASSLAALKSNVLLMDRAGAPLATLKVQASSEGTWGDKLKVTIADNGADKFDITVLETVSGTDVQRDKFVGCTMDPSDAVNYVENKVNEQQKKYIQVTDQFTATATFATKRPAATTTALATGNDGLTGLVDTDFVGSTVTKSGIYAMNSVNELLTFAIPGKSTTAIHTAAFAYAETRGDRYFVGDLPFGLTSAAAITYVKTTLGANSDFGEFNWPHLGVTDPMTGLRKVIPNSAFIMAAMGRTFDAVGPWKVAAGISDGKMLGATYLESEEVNDVSVRDSLYGAQINPIYFVPDYGICRMGSLTATADPNKKQNINQRWTFLYCEDSIKRGTLWELFENIDDALFKKAERTIKAFLLTVWRRGGLKGVKPTEAFYVQVDGGNNPASEITLGNINHRIGLAVHTPGQFAYFSFERDTRALEAELAAAGL